MRVTASVLNVRSGPGPAFRVLGQLRSGDDVDVLEAHGEWVWVDDGPDTAVFGWASRAHLAADEPAWIAAARSKIGEREIPGSKNNPWITSFWQRLGAKWYNDDETPWCGGFAAWCLNEAGLPYPKNFPAAASFRDYGIDCAAQLGAIGVKARKGGNHVFFIVGETPDRLYYKGLGGNQSNMVSITDIRKTDVDEIRWPAGVPQSVTLPTLPAGTIAASEA